MITKLTVALKIGADTEPFSHSLGPERHFAAANNNVAIGVTTDIDRHGY